MRKEQKTVEQVIKQKAEREELRQLRNLKYNLEAGIVLNISPELVRVLMNKHWRDL